MNISTNESSLRRGDETKSNPLLHALSAADFSRSSVPFLVNFFEGRKYQYISETRNGKIALFSDFPSTSIYSRIATCIMRVFNFNDSSERDITLKKLSFSQIKTKVKEELDNQTIDREIKNEIAEKFRALIDRFELKPMGIFAYIFHPVSTKEIKSSRFKEAAEARAMLNRFTNPSDTRHSGTDLSETYPRNSKTPQPDPAVKIPKSILSRKTGRGESTPAKQVKFISPISDDATTPPALPYGIWAMSGLNTAARRELNEFEKNLGKQKQSPWDDSILCSPVSTSGSPTAIYTPGLNESSLLGGPSQILDITGFNLSTTNISGRGYAGDPNCTAGDLSRDLRHMFDELEEITGKPISSTS